MVGSKTIYSWVICILLALAILAGCSGREVPDTDQWPEDIPRKAFTGSVPFYPQKEYQCGPSALAMVLNWSGKKTTPDQISGWVFTPSLKGSLQPAMIAGTRRSGRVAYEIDGNEALHREIAAGHPVIVLQNLGLSWYPVWHYAVAFGYDAEVGEIVLHSGAEANKRMPIPLFQKTWARGNNWGLLVIPPNRLPATANESKYVQAALGLEKAGENKAALTAFRTAHKRWPHNFIALMGIGNNFYALGDLTRSAKAFAEAARLHPEAGDAINNLAQVLYELGRHREAENAARSAIELGGPHKQVYRQTLEQIISGGKNR